METDDVDHDRHVIGGMSISGNGSSKANSRSKKGMIGAIGNMAGFGANGLYDASSILIYDIFCVFHLHICAILTPQLDCWHGGGERDEAQGAEAAEDFDPTRTGGALRRLLQHYLEA
jgi:hypothetical protein